MYASPLVQAIMYWNRSAKRSDTRHTLITNIPKHSTDHDMYGGIRDQPSVHSGDSRSDSAFLGS
jgi:hypothetical protein